jgi:hypothetical protein
MNAIVDTQSFGGGVNAMGQVVGSRFPSGSGFLWTPTTLNGSTGSAVDVGLLPGASRTDPLAINSIGHVVGIAVGLTDGAFLWEPTSPNSSDGSLLRLTSLLSPADAAQWRLTSARGINDMGQIVGYGFFDPDGPGGTPPVTRGYLLTPVPEPSTFALATILAISISRSARRHILGRLQPRSGDCA